jgi:hypothetical protein
MAKGRILGFFIRSEAVHLTSANGLTPKPLSTAALYERSTSYEQARRKSVPDDDTDYRLALLRPSPTRATVVKCGTASLSNDQHRDIKS